MITSKISRNIKKRVKPKDVFITPIELAKKHIQMIEYNENDIWFDPFKNSGNYYNNFPNENKLWCEILDGRDFFKFNQKVDIICSNPPYSMIDKILKKCIELKPRIISFLIGVNNLTTRRIQLMNDNGYYLNKIKMLKVYSWFGMSFIVHFELNKKNCLQIDRKVYF
tara:strand:- start:521 stop:1021 length:501 start_codon:yes stop_codon:yes gene_type:complete